MEGGFDEVVSCFLEIADEFGLELAEFGVDRLIVECCLDLTRRCWRMSLRVDPCAHGSLTGFVGEHWSDRHGIFKYNSPLGIA